LEENTMTKLMTLTALALFVFSLPGAPVAAAKGATASRHHIAGRKVPKKRPVIRPDSARYPGGRCGKLNLERARLYGLCK
jgi:hypothetical protein